jgi:hypothetical protein
VHELACRSIMLPITACLDKCPHCT